jgi:signal peptidase I
MVRLLSVMWLIFGLVFASLVNGCGADSVDVASRVSASDVSASKNTGFISLGRAPQGYRVPSGSMEPTLAIGSRVVIKKAPPSVGAIVVFHPPENAQREECGPTPHVVKLGGASCSTSVPRPAKVRFIKRIVAGPGDQIYIHEGHVYRKAAGTSSFVRESDSYIKSCGGVPECNFPTPISIPSGYWFMLGDNRGESDDSRFYGPVPAAWIVGMVTDVACPTFRHGRLAWVHRTIQEGCGRQS